MIQLTPEQYATLNDWFAPETPGPLIGRHILNTGHGTIVIRGLPNLGGLEES